MCVRAHPGKESARERACACSREVAEVEGGVLQIQPYDWCMLLSVLHACLLIKIYLRCLYSSS